jgi:hypothetical protein
LFCSASTRSVWSYWKLAEVCLAWRQEARTLQQRHQCN